MKTITWDGHDRTDIVLQSFYNKTTKCNWNKYFYMNNHCNDSAPVGPRLEIKYLIFLLYCNPYRNIFIYQELIFPKFAWE